MVSPTYTPCEGYQYSQREKEKPPSSIDHRQCPEKGETLVKYRPETMSKRGQDLNKNS